MKQQKRNQTTDTRVYSWKLYGSALYWQI